MRHLLTTFCSGLIHTYIFHCRIFKYSVGLRSTRDLTSVKNESVFYNDIVVLNFQDTYRNLTIKTLTSLHWAVNTFNTSFILKADDDTVANVRKIISLLQRKINPNSEIILGDCVAGVAVDRNMTSKYYISYHDYPFRAWPPFCFGTGYMISSLAVRHLLQLVNQTRLYHLEDVSMGLLANKVPGVRILNVDLWRGISLNWNRCQRTFTFHDVRPEVAEMLWKRCMMGANSDGDVIPARSDGINFPREPFGGAP